MKPVFEKLELLEISPNGKGASPKTSPKSQASADLIDRVIRRAEELRRVWADPEPTSGQRRATSQAAGKVAVS